MQRPPARWASWPARWPRWPESSACAGGRSWTPSSSTALRSWTTPTGSGRSGPLASTRRSFLSARPEHPTIYATGLVDLDRRILIDMVEGNSAADLRRWTKGQDKTWLGAITVVAMDLTEHYRAGVRPDLAHAMRVADPFHVVRVANRCVDKVRRRVQNETLLHRGRKADPLYRIRKLLLAGAERLDERGHDRLLLGLRRGDPHDETLGSWLAKESVRDVFLTDDLARPPPLRQGHRRLPERRGRRDPLPRRHPPALATRDLEPPPHRGFQRSDRRTQPLRQANQALRTRLHPVRSLPAPGAAPRRRRHLAQAPVTASHQNPCSLLQRVEPPKAGVASTSSWLLRLHEVDRQSLCDIRSVRNVSIGLALTAIEGNLILQSVKKPASHFGRHFGSPHNRRSFQGLIGLEADRASVQLGSPVSSRPSEPGPGDDGPVEMGSAAMPPSLGASPKLKTAPRADETQ